jgi:hypothetical protein
MRRALRHRLERLANDFGDVVIANLARRARTRLVEKAIAAMLGESAAPFAQPCRGRADAQADVSVFRAFSREQHDTRPLAPVPAPSSGATPGSPAPDARSPSNQSVHGRTAFALKRMKLK